jgi:hypothetical protein
MKPYFNCLLKVCNLPGTISIKILPVWVLDIIYQQPKVAPAKMREWRIKLRSWMC